MDEAFVVGAGPYGGLVVCELGDAALIKRGGGVSGGTKRRRSGWLLVVGSWQSLDLHTDVIIVTVRTHDYVVFLSRGVQRLVVVVCNRIRLDEFPERGELN